MATTKQTWKESLMDKIIKLTHNIDSRVFTMKDIKKIIPIIVTETQSVGKTPEQTVARELQNVRDMGIIKFHKDNAGTYTVVKNISEIDKHAKNKSRQSVGEKLFANVLSKLNVQYIEQFIDNRIRRINPLPFDFAFNINGRAILVEIDGADHYQVVRRSRSEVANVYNHIMRKRRDRIKDEGSQKYGYILYRIDARDLKDNKKGLKFLENQLQNILDEHNCEVE